MSKVTNLTKQTADFKELQKLKRVLGSEQGRHKLEKIGQLDVANQHYQDLQGTVVKFDTKVREDRASAKLLSKVTLPTDFAPFDPKGSGFLDSLQNQVSSALAIFTQNPLTVAAPGAPLGDGTGAWAGQQDFNSGLSDIANRGVEERNKALAQQTSDNATAAKKTTVVVIGAVVVAFLVFRKR